MNSKKNTLLFTASFPYGIGEQFLETEIIYLCQEFEMVYILPYHKTDEVREIPTNCKVIDLTVNYSIKSRIRKCFFSHFRVIFSVLFTTLLKSNHRKCYLLNLKKRIIDLIIEIEIANKYFLLLNNYLQNIDTIYFYWFDKPILSFCILKHQKKIKHTLLTRAHGYDYDHNQNSFHKFREYELTKVDKVLPVSKYGVSYFKKHYPTLSNKINVSYLGTNNLGENPINFGNTLQIVSCSRFIPLKRLHLIIKILKELSIDVIWTHFGSGPLQDDIALQAKALPSNVIVNFKGFTDNYVIMNFYKNTHIDFFINVSNLEGIPVSIMEAISFGIPVIGCNVCGVPEIVNDRTGYLFEENFNPKEVAEKILMHYNKPLYEKIEFTKQVKSFWKEKFNAEINYTDFIISKLK